MVRVDQYPVQTLPIDPTGNIGFPLSNLYQARDIKRILGESFSLAKTSKHLIVSINPKKVVCLSQFDEVLVLLETIESSVELLRLT